MTTQVIEPIAIMPAMQTPVTGTLEDSRHMARDRSMHPLAHPIAQSHFPAMADAHDIRPDAKRLVEQLPPDASWDDLAYEVYVRQAVEQGVADADSGRTVDHETALARVRARIRRPA